MLTIVAAIVFVCLFFMMPASAIGGSIGFLIAGPVGAVLGAGLGFVIDLAVQA